MKDCTPFAKRGVRGSFYDFLFAILTSNPLLKKDLSIPGEKYLLQKGAVLFSYNRPHFRTAGSIIYIFTTNYLNGWY